MAVVVLFNGAVTVLGISPWLTEGRLWDSDCYMRLQRVVNLQRSGDWYDSVEPRSNAPFGEQLHWTRPLDALLLAGAWAGSRLVDFRQALWDWGVVISPLLLLIGLQVWSWGTASLLSPALMAVSAVLLLFSLPFSPAFLIGRPDHHSLIGLCLMGSLACLLRLLAGDERDRPAVYAGLWAGLGLWVSLESLVGQGLIGTALALAWVWRGGEHARRLACFSQAMTVALAVALVVEYRPADWGHIRFARFTVVDLALAAGCAAAWTAIAAAAPASRLARAAWTLAGAAVPGVVMAVLFPDFFRGPMIDFSPAAVAWLATLSEFEPLWPGSARQASAFLLQLGPSLIAIVWCVGQIAFGASGRKPLWLALLLGNAVFLWLALGAGRWAQHANLFAALPWAMALGAAARRPRRLVGKAGAVTLLLVGHVYAALALRPAALAEPAPAGGHCDWRPVAATLRQAWPDGGVLFSYLFAGGELIWRTPFAVVGAPYQNAESLADTEAVFNALDDDVARAVLTRRRVDLLLLCDDDAEAAGYRRRGEAIFHNRLLAGRLPPWLRPVELTAAQAGRARLFQLVPR